MFRRRRYEPQRHHHNNPRIPLFEFLRRPVIQLGILILTALVIVFLVLTGQNSPGTQDKTTLTGNAQTQPGSTPLPAVITVNAAYQLYTSHSAYFLDVRERSEWDQMHIPTTTLLPLSQVSALVEKLPTDKPIVVISGADNRSQQARDIIKDAGIIDVTSMAGGIATWKQQRYPIEP